MTLQDTNINPHIIPASQFVGVGHHLPIVGTTASHPCLGCGMDIYFSHPFYTRPYHPDCEILVQQGAMP